MLKFKIKGEGITIRMRQVPPFVGTCAYASRYQQLTKKNTIPIKNPTFTSSKIHDDR